MLVYRTFFTDKAHGDRQVFMAHPELPQMLVVEQGESEDETVEFEQSYPEKVIDEESRGRKFRAYLAFERANPYNGNAVHAFPVFQTAEEFITYYQSDTGSDARKLVNERPDFLVPGEKIFLATTKKGWYSSLKAMFAQEAEARKAVAYVQKNFPYTDTKIDWHIYEPNAATFIEHCGAAGEPIKPAQIQIYEPRLGLKLKPV